MTQIVVSKAERRDTNIEHMIFRCKSLPANTCRGLPRRPERWLLIQLINQIIKL